MQRSLYSTSSSPSSSSRMFDAETMEEDLNEVRELPLELLNSDIGEMHEEQLCVRGECKKLDRVSAR